MRIVVLALAALMALPAPAARHLPAAAASRAEPVRSAHVVALSSKERRRRERYLRPASSGKKEQRGARNGSRGGARPPGAPREKTPGEKATDAFTLALSIGLIGWLASASLPAFGAIGLLALLFPFDT